jgi:Flp pilus assembly protein TadD
MMRLNRVRLAAAALGVLAATVLAVAPARCSPAADTPAHRLAAAAPPATAVAAPAERLRTIVALIDQTRARAAAPGLSEEERDALAEIAWAQADEALEDPSLREWADRDPDFLQVRALLLLDDEEDEEALAVLQRLALIAPQDPETQRLLALALEALGRTDGAVQAYRRALSLQVEGAAEVRARLAYALAAAGRLDEGLLESERALAEDPAAYLGHFMRGWILGKLGRGEEERREYLEAVRRERDDADLWGQLALSWERAGERARAVEAWREVRRIDPTDAEAAAKLAAGP